ncbi:Abortive infection protein [Methanothermus fervidus DSM 2088]|uniref:Abortive infection protein n=1 Tax=Methanothermus fervidus (strain ATCC 43054 / DSM 2088 / JCM 10308 / V24 S) TaxID=523846 RepID=E3GYJ4_METFV|nr:type II CAAX endopeptidase family protein [Methanothermus fervidus]ADP77376.1 Abortive infection protein [Methanothermus fervidus DSM 2088]
MSNLTEFIDLAKKGKNDWWRYLISLFFILFLPAFLFIPIYILFSILGLDIVSPRTGMEGVFSLLGTNIYYCCLLLSFYISLRIFHNRKFKTVVTSHSKFRFKRFFSGFFAWSLVLTLFLLIDLYFDPHSYKLNFKMPEFLMLFLVSLATTPIQAGFEEIFFRGYALQAINLITNKRIYPVIITSIIFATGHWGNGTSLVANLDIFIDTLIYALIASIITLTDGGLEAVIGIHTANNLFSEVIVSSSYYMPLPSIFISAELPEPLFQLLFSLLSSALLIFILYRKNWNKLSTTLHKLF